MKPTYEELEQWHKALLAQQPVWRCREGQDPELFYNGYWFVKRSHAARRVREAEQRGGQVVAQATWEPGAPPPAGPASPTNAAPQAVDSVTGGYVAPWPADAA